MVFEDTIMNYLDWNILPTVNTDTSDRQLFSVISKNTKPIYLFLRKLIKPQHNYTTT